jgi:hypothetical protein
MTSSRLSTVPARGRNLAARAADGVFPIRLELGPVVRAKAIAMIRASIPAGSRPDSKRSRRALLKRF